MKNLLLAVSFFCTIFTVFGQEERVIVVDRGTNARFVPKQRKLVDNTSVIKFSPLQMIVGELNFGYERVIDDISSVEFEFGPTISNVGLAVEDNHFYSSWGYTGQTSRIGFFGSAAYRFYPLDNGKVLNGFYVSPVFKYRLMNFGMRDYSGNLEDTKGNESHAYFTMNFGMQRWLSQHFSIDYFAGIGLGYEAKNSFQTVSEYNGVTGEYSYFWNKNAYDGVRFLFTIGLKVGIGR